MMNRLSAFLQLPQDFLLMVVTYLPGPFGYSVRVRYWKRKLKHLGNNVKIDTGVYFQNPDYIVIDDNCWIDRNVVILAGMDQSKREKITLKNQRFKGEQGVVYIGKNVHVGPGCIISGISAGVYISDDCCFSAHCKVFAFSHHYRSKEDPRKCVHFGSMASHSRQCIIEGPVYLGFNTGVALNSVILPGTDIPDNCFVTINSVVGYGKYDENSIIGGNPAKKIGDRFSLENG